MRTEFPKIHTGEKYKLSSDLAAATKDYETSYKPVTILNMVSGSYEHHREIIEKINVPTTAESAQRANGFFSATKLDGTQKFLNMNYISCIDNSYNLCTITLKLKGGSNYIIELLTKVGKNIVVDNDDPDAMLEKLSTIEED